MQQDTVMTKQKPTNLSVGILRPAHGMDCTLHGITSRHESVRDSEEPHVNAGNVAIVTWFGYYKALPTDCDGQPIHGGMFGGNFIWSSDSRWRKLYPHPIPVHDRFER